MRRALVTGGAGFIGSHLCDALLESGYQVRVLDDLSTGRAENVPGDAVLIAGSVEDAELVSAAVDGVDVCFHLAAIASVERGAREWLQTHRVNASGMVTILDAIARRGSRVPVIYASSAAVYGDCAALPVGEDSARAPLSAYGADKHACEMHASVATRVHGIPTTGLRFFNVYGPRQDPSSPYSGVISIFADRIGRGAPVTIFGDGAQTRDFVHVSDVVSALIRAMRARLTDAPVFNVCTGAPCSVVTLARMIGRVCGCRPEIEFQAARTGEIRCSLGDPARGRAALGLAPAITLAEGLRTLLLPGGRVAPGWQAARGLAPGLHGGASPPNRGFGA